MNVLFKYFLILFGILLQLNVSAQNEYEDDLEFKRYKTIKKEKKNFEGKRLVNLHFELGYNLSTVLGEGVTETRDTLDAITRRFGLDSYNIVPSFWPTASVQLSLNFIERASLVFGLKYNMLGWREVAKIDDPNFFLRFKSKYELHKLSVPLAIHFHPTRTVSVFVGTSLAFSVQNQIVGTEIQIFNQDTLVNIKEVVDFEQRTLIEPRLVAPQIFLGGNFGFDQLRFNINFTFTPNFIRNDIPYNNISAEAGVILKLFKDYDKDF